MSNGLGTGLAWLVGWPALALAATGTCTRMSSSRFSDGVLRRMIPTFLCFFLVARPRETDSEHNTQLARMTQVSRLKQWQWRSGGVEGGKHRKWEDGKRQRSSQDWSGRQHSTSQTVERFVVLPRTSQIRPSTCENGKREKKKYKGTCTKYKAQRLPTHYLGTY